LPFSDPAGSGGVSISTVPIDEAAGHSTGARVPDCLNWASVQATRFPEVAEGLSPIPAGRVILAFRRWDSEIVSPPVRKGSVVCTVAAAGESTWLVPGSVVSPGSKGTFMQPVGIRPSGVPAGRAVEPVGKLASGSP
jgi:hypothetical protein